MIAVLVIFFIIAAIFSRPDIVQPLLVTAVPLNRLAQAVVQGDLRLPAQLRLNFIASQGIPAIMSPSILNVSNQRFGFLSQSKQFSHKGKIFRNVRSTNIVDLSEFSTFEHG